MDEFDLGLFLDEVARGLVDHLSAEVAGARKLVDRPGVGDVLQLLLAHERRRPAAAFSAASNIGRHMNLSAVRVPRVPVQAVLLDVEPRQHRRVGRQRRRAADRARLQRVGGPLQDRLVNGGITPVSASGRRPSSLMMTTWRIAARPLTGRFDGEAAALARSRRPAPRRAAGGCRRGAGRRRRSRAARRQAGTRHASARPTSVSDGLAGFPICLNLAPSEFNVRRRARSPGPPRRSRASRPGSVLTRSTEGGLRVTRTVTTGSPC